MCVMHNVRCCCDLFVEVYAHFRSTRLKSKVKTGNYLKRYLYFSKMLGCGLRWIEIVFENFCHKKRFNFICIIIAFMVAL